LPAEQEKRAEAVARVLLQRYGVVFRRLAVHEAVAAPWRDLLRACRRLEARGEIRGGRFVTGVSGEQFALPDAVTRLREVRRERTSGTVTIVAASDPLNLTGVVDAGEHIRSGGSARIAFLDGAAVAVLEGEYLRTLAALDHASSAAVAAALTGRSSLAVAEGFVGRPRRALGR
jgi:ATP-dependent Lhr-like helicase